MMRARSASAAWLLALALSAGAAPAAAHGLAVTAQREGDAVSGQARYSSLEPAAGLYVELRRDDQPGDGATLATGLTAADGRFRLPAPAGLQLRVIVEGEEGHRAETTVAALAAPAATAAAGDDAPAASTLQLLREDIARLEQRILLRDIVGGIGYIVGLAGIAAWVAARRKP